MNLFDHFQYIPCRPCQTVEFPDNDRIPRAQVLLHTLQTCSLTVHPRGVFLEDALTARLLKQLKLAVQVLVRRRYTYCMPRFCPPLHDVMCCEYNRFPTRTQHWQGKSRRRKDDTDVGTTARGVVGRLHRVP